MPLTLLQARDHQATLCQHATYELQWTADCNYAPGSYIELRCGTLRAFVLWRLVDGYVEDGDVHFRWKSRPTVSDMWTNGRRCWLRAQLRGGLRVGQSRRITLVLIPPHQAQLTQTLTLWAAGVPAATAASARGEIADAELEWPKQPEAACALPVCAGPVERLGVWSWPAPGPDGTVRTVLAPLDMHGNPSVFAAPVPCELRWADRAWTETLQGRVTLHLEAPAAGTVGRLQVAVPMDALALDENIANSRRQDAALHLTGNPVWPEPPDGLLPAFGEIHWHTDFSGDGQGRIADAFAAARDELNLQFAAPSDHSPRGDAWRQTVEAVEAANQPDVFATFLGWEKSTQNGHENYYFTDPACTFTMDGCEPLRGTRPEQTTALLNARADRILAVPHHSNAVAESRRLSDDVPFWYPYEWDREVAPARRLVEIFQTRGNQERDNYTDAWRGWHCRNGASAQDALALGYRIGFTGGTDNHTASPGRAWAHQEGGSLHPTWSQLMTGVWTPRVERQAVFDALYARHTWAVWDCRAIVHLTVNGTLAGGDLTVAKGTELIARIRISADDALQVIELVSEGHVLWSAASHAPDCTLSAALGPATAATHIYLRARQRDGALIYASPVFIDLT